MRAARASPEQNGRSGRSYNTNLHATGIRQRTMSSGLDRLSVSSCLRRSGYRISGLRQAVIGSKKVAYSSTSLSLRQPSQSSFLVHEYDRCSLLAGDGVKPSVLLRPLCGCRAEVPTDDHAEAGPEATSIKWEGADRTNTFAERATDDPSIGAHWASNYLQDSDANSDGYSGYTDSVKMSTCPVPIIHISAACHLHLPWRSRGAYVRHVSSPVCCAVIGHG